MIKSQSDCVVSKIVPYMFSTFVLNLKKMTDTFFSAEISTRCVCLYY